MKKQDFYYLGLLLVLGLAVGAAWLSNKLSGQESYVSEGASGRSQAEILEACDVHIQRAVAEGNELIDRRTAEFASFIEERKPGAKPFSKELVSFYGKWRVVKPYLPGTNNNGHKQYVEGAFAKKIFSAKELEGVTERVMIESAKDLEGVENRLAVKIKKEISGGAAISVDPSISMNEFSVAIDRVKVASKWDAEKAGGSLLASEVVSMVGTKVLSRLAVSGGLLAAGAGSSWWTFGAGLGLGLAADWVWEKIDDPADDIERETLNALTQISEKGANALRDELGAVLIGRRELWEKAVKEVVT